MENYISNNVHANSKMGVDRLQKIITNSVGINGANIPSDILLIQELLQAIGYQILPNGRLNNDTTDPTILSLINFQSNNSLTVTGVVVPNDTTYTTLKIKSQNVTISESDDESVHQPFVTNAFSFRWNANKSNTLNVIFEGDSWLDYPVPKILDLYDTISDRNQKLNLNALHLAKFGETTTNMYNDRKNFVNYISNYRIDRVYFSGGGNDIFPKLDQIINPGKTTFRNSYFTDQSKLNDLRSTPAGDALYQKCILYKRYLNSNAFEHAVFNAVNLRKIFQEICNNYLRFGNIVNTYGSANLIFYMHTYDYPIFKLGKQPSFSGINLPLGPWIKPVFDRYGITDEILRSYIIIHLLDQFADKLDQVKREFNRRNYVFQTKIINYRGMLNRSEYWRDEIHPSSAGARRLATQVTF